VSVCGVGLAGLPRPDEVGVAAVKAVRAQVGIHGVGPVAMVGAVAVGVPRRDDFDDQVIRANARAATGRYRAGTLLAARRLADLGALKPGVSVDDANDMLWFYFGYSGFSR
jgi:hypothetical protein